MNYLIIIAGYEGIERIVGLFDKDEAVRRIIELRANCQRLADEEKDNLSIDEWENLYDSHAFENPDQFCVQYVDSNGSKCVCNELGVGLDKTWFIL